MPLGTRRRFGPAPVENQAPVQLAQPSPSAFPRERDHETPTKRPREESSTPTGRKWLLYDCTVFTLSHPYYFSCIADQNAPRKRRSRWGDNKTELPGLPTAISADGISQAQLDNYAIQLRLEEINRKLRLNDYIPPENERYAMFLLSKPPKTHMYDEIPVSSAYLRFARPSFQYQRSAISQEIRR